MVSRRRVLALVSGVVCVASYNAYEDSEEFDDDYDEGENLEDILDFLQSKAEDRAKGRSLGKTSRGGRRGRRGRRYVDITVPDNNNAMSGLMGGMVHQGAMGGGMMGGGMMGGGAAMQGNNFYHPAPMPKPVKPNLKENMKCWYTVSPGAPYHVKPVCHKEWKSWGSSWQAGTAAPWANRPGHFRPGPAGQNGLWWYNGGPAVPPTSYGTHVPTMGIAGGGAMGGGAMLR